jgi:hypothetical protein
MLIFLFIIGFSVLGSLLLYVIDIFIQNKALRVENAKLIKRNEELRSLLPLLGNGPSALDNRKILHG